MSTVAGVDVTTLSDTDLAAFEAACGTETVRRLNLASLPAQVAQIAQVYVSAGGQVADLVSAVEGSGS